MWSISLIYYFWCSICYISRSGGRRWETSYKYTYTYMPLRKISLFSITGLPSMRIKRGLDYTTRGDYRFAQMSYFIPHIVTLNRNKVVKHTLKKKKLSQPITENNAFLKAMNLVNFKSIYRSRTQLQKGNFSYPPQR